MKTIECKDRERILCQQDPAMLEALDRHAAGCAECAEELRFWREISTAAKEMHRTWESPYLWPRIERALTVGQVFNLPFWTAGWKPAPLAAVMAMVLLL